MADMVSQSFGMIRETTRSRACEAVIRIEDERHVVLQSTSSFFFSVDSPRAKDLPSLRCLRRGQWLCRGWA